MKQNILLYNNQNKAKNINLYNIEKIEIIDYELNLEKIKNIKLIEEINNLKKKIEEQEILLDNKEKKIKELNKKIKKMENQACLPTYLNSNNLNIIELMKKLELKENELKELKSLLPFDISKEDKLMTIIFTSIDENILCSCICKNTDKFKRLENLIIEQYPEYMKVHEYYFIFKKKIEKDRTLEENLIRNNDIIIIDKFSNDS